MQILSIDWETYPIVPGNLQPKPVVLSITGNSEVGAELLTPGTAARVLRAALEDQNIKLIGHNIAFDLGVLVKWYPEMWPLVFEAYEQGRISDTKIRQQLIDIAAGCHNQPRRDGSKGYSLADLEFHYFARERFEEKNDPDSWRLRFGELESVPMEQWPEAAVSYAKADAQGTLEVYQKQKDMPGEEDSVRGAWALHLLSCHGVMTDAVRVEALEARLLVARKENQLLFLEAGLLKPEPLSAEDRRSGVEPAFFEPRKRDPKGLGPRPMKYTKNMAVIRAKVEDSYRRRGQLPPETESGAISTDRDTLIHSGEPVLEALGEASNNEKLLTTYIPLLKRGTKVPINARFNALVNSGRTSCADPNLQNMPRAPGVRECFVPRPGMVFVSADYDTLELRALAQVCLWLFGKSKMAEAIRAGKDLHLEFAAQMLGIRYADAVARKAEKEIKEARQFGKIFNFGKPGGLGITTLIEFARTSYGVVMREDEARELSAEWLKAWPEMEYYFAYISKLVGEGGATIKSFGNGMIRGNAGYCDTANHFFQNLAAQGAKDALFYVTRECYVDCGTALFGCGRPWNFPHDEIIVEVPEDRVQEAAQRLVKVMVERMSLRIPDVPITSSASAMTRCWSKEDKEDLIPLTE